MKSKQLLQQNQDLRAKSPLPNAQFQAYLKDKKPAKPQQLLQSQPLQSLSQITSPKGSVIIPKKKHSLDEADEQLVHKIRESQKRRIFEITDVKH